MAKTDIQKCMDWLLQQQGELEGAPFGRGKSSVLQALAVQFSKVKDIAKVKGDISSFSEIGAPDDKSLAELSGIYDSVKAVCDKRNSCLEVVNQIASLEDHVQTLSVEIDARSVFLVSTSDVTKDQGDDNKANESLARTTQACISSVRENWKWIFQLLQCAEVHLRNASEYQEYFQEAEEAEYWMNTTLPGIHLSFDRSKVVENISDGESLLLEINDVLAAYQRWQTKTDYLLDKAKRVVPVPLRLKPLPSARPVLALTDFKAEEGHDSETEYVLYQRWFADPDTCTQIEFIEGETLILVDNSDKKKWKVQTETGKSGTVPAVIILITAPSSEAIDYAIKLRLQLLSLWTSSVKNLGYRLIAYMLLVFREWTAEEIAFLQAISASGKKNILRILLFIEETLLKNWGGYGDFQVLQERINKLRALLEAASDTNSEQDGDEAESNSFSISLISQVNFLELLLKKYKEFWELWEIFKCVVELLKHPRFMLVCDKWEQLRFITSAKFVRFWDTQLEIDTSTVTSDVKPISDEGVDSDLAIQDSKQETTTDTVTSSLQEERHTFMIKGVIDPRDNSTQLTFQEAVALGIVDADQKHYTNPNTGKTISMTDAMNEGLVLMELVSKKKIREEQNSYGVITVTSFKEQRPYTIIGVKDPVTEAKISVSEAVTKKILDSAYSTYRADDGEIIPIADAIHLGFVRVKYQEGAVEQKSEVVTKTYIVHGVVDQQKKQKVSFSDAVQNGLLTRDTGEYINNVTNEHVGIQEAILKGFIKARIASDPSKIEINPENTIVVEKISSVKAKLFKSVQAVKAFKA